MKACKKIITIIMVLALIFVFTACSQTPSTSTDPTATPEPTAAIDEPTAAPTEEPAEEEAFDMGGKVIRVASWWSDIPSAEATDENGKREYQRMKDIEEKYNCVFEAVVVPADDIGVQFDAAVLANDIFAEIIYMRSESAADRASQGQLFPLNTVFDLSKPQFNESITNSFTTDGQTYALSTFGNSLDSMMVFNKDIFARIGLDDPYELVKNKEWTWEKLEEYITKATIKSASSSEPEVYGIFGVTTDPIISQVAASFGAEFVHKDESGVYSSGLSDENMKNALDYLVKLNTTNPGVMVPPADAPWDYGITQFQAGKVAMLIGSSGKDVKESMTDKFGTVPIPLVKAGDDYTLVVESHNVRVMQNSLDPEFAKQIAYVYSLLTAPLIEDEAEALEMQRAGLENSYWDSESVDLILELEQKESKMFNHYGATTVFWDIVAKPLGAALRGETTVASVIAAAEEAFNEDIARTNAENAK